MTCSFCDATGGDIWLKNSSILRSCTKRGDELSSVRMLAVAIQYAVWSLVTGCGLVLGGAALATWWQSLAMTTQQAGARESGVICIHYFAVVLTQKHVDM